MTVNGKRIGKYLRAWAVAGLAALSVACSDSSPDKLLSSAKDYLAKGDRQAAIIQLRNALQSMPDNVEARFLLGQASLDGGDFASAEKELRRALELGYSADVVLPMLARAMTEVGQEGALVKEFSDRTLTDPQATATFQTLLGDAYVQQNDASSAAKAYSVALAAIPDYAPARLGQAVLVAREGRLDEALVQAESILAVSPDLATAHRLKSDLLRAKGDRAGAKSSLERAIELEPRFLPARLSLLSLLIEEKDLGAATKLLESTRKVAPRDPQVTYFEALIAYREGELERARQQVQQVLKVLPNHVPSLVLAGTMDLRDGRFVTAEESLRKAVGLAPGESGARQLLVLTQLRMGQPARAKDTLQAFLDRGMPSDTRWQLLAGETYLANGDARRAMAYYEMAAKGEKAGQAAAAKTRLGQIALASGQSDAGFAELEAASELDPGAYQADLALIAGHLRRNEMDRAMAAVKALERKQPRNPLTFQMYGLVNVGKRDYAAARASFERALELQPDYLPSAYNLSVLDVLDKKPDEARKRFETLIAKFPNNELLYLALADLQSRTGSTREEVLETLGRAVRANPQSPTARVALINAQLRAGQGRLALVSAQEALSAMPADPRVLEAAGMAQEAAGEINQAIGTYNKLASLEPNSAQHLYRLAGLYVREKDTDRAMDALRRIQKMSPMDRRVVQRIVQVSVGGGRYDDALREARDFQRKDPTDAVGWALEGDVHLAQKRFVDAQRLYREGLKRDPKATPIGVMLHTALVLDGKTAEADALAKKWVVDNPKDAAMRIYLGDREVVAKNLKAAATQYQAAVAIQPDNAQTLSKLAWVSGELGDPKALEYSRRAAALAPRDAAVVGTYGMLLTKQGQAALGLEQLNLARALAPDRHELGLQYAKALMQAGQRDQARVELEALQKVPEDFRGKSEIPELLKSL